MTEAQKHPLRIRTQVAQLYNPLVSNFNTPDNEIIKIEVETGTGRFPDQVKLHFVIERIDTPSITLRTDPTNSVPAVNLNEHVDTMHKRTRFITYPINNYLQPTSLIIEGEDRNYFLQSSQLPEGTYNLSTTLVEPKTNKIISNTSLVTLHIKWLAAPEVHEPVFPDNRTAVFNWSASQDSITKLFITTYAFQLAMLSKNDNANNPTSAFIPEQLIFTTIIQTNQVIIDLSKVHLIPGQLYAVQVRAYHPEGKSLFRNEGKSEFYVFQR